MAPNIVTIQPPKTTRITPRTRKDPSLVQVDFQNTIDTPESKWEPVGKKLKKQNKIKKIRKLLKKRNKKPIQLGDCKN